MRHFVRQQISKLLGHLAFEVHSGLKSPTEERVHDLRVAIRRLQAALGAFDEFLPKRRTRLVRKQLRGLLRAAGAVRDRDIAIELLSATGAAEEDTLLAQLLAERQQAAADLTGELRILEKQGYSARWRDALELPR